MKTRFLFSLVPLLLLTSPVAQAQVTAYTDETTFLNDIANLGYDWFQEDFEDNAVWGSVRFPLTAPSISNKSVIWSANNPDGGVTTSSGAASSGTWGFFTMPHGSFSTGVDCHLPEKCGDGFVGTSEMTLYASGGWFSTNTPFAKIGMFIGGYPNNPVDFGETCPPSGEDCSDNAIIGTQPQFFGVIDPSGFNQFEFRELEGKKEDAKYIFSDLFTIVSACPTWICPAGMSSGWRVILNQPGD
jgi:hypothetical protein